MTVKEFYDWCKIQGFEDADLRMADQMIQTRDFPVSEWNINVAIRKAPDGKKHKVMIIGGWP